MSEKRTDVVMCGNTPGEQTGRTDSCWEAPWFWCCPMLLVKKPFVIWNDHVRHTDKNNQGEVVVLREEKKMLTGQARKLNNELRASLRRKEAASAQQAELNETINELELECRAAEGDVR